MYKDHLVAVQAAHAQPQDQLLPHATPFIFVILGLDEAPATQELAAHADQAHPLPQATSMFKDHWFNAAQATHGLLPVGRVHPAVQLFPFLLIVQFHDKVHFTNTL